MNSEQCLSKAEATTDTVCGAQSSANAGALEQEHVHAVYDRIAMHFSSTRYKPWPLVEKFLQSLPQGTLLADVGCGNGKYLHVNPLCYPIGSDRSGELIAICKERGFESLVADNLSLPYRSSCFEAVISIAVIHHMANDERRIQAIRELGRILRPGGMALITVWAFEQKDKKYTEQDVFVPWHLQKKFVKGQEDAAQGAAQKKLPKKKKKTRKQRTKEELQRKQREERGESVLVEHHAHEGEEPQESEAEALAPTESKQESDQAEVFHRYYHLFAEGELERIVQAAGGLRVVESAFDHENWYVCATKEV